MTRSSKNMISALSSISDEELQAQREEDRLVRETELRNKIGIYYDEHRYTFASLIIDAENSKDRDAYEKAMQYADLLIKRAYGHINGKEDLNLILLSPRNGNGKTMLSICVINHLLEEANRIESRLLKGLPEREHYLEQSLTMTMHRLRKCFFMPPSDLLPTAFSDKDDKQALYEHIQKNYFLLNLDDIGKEVSETSVEKIHHVYHAILDSRYRRGLPTIITTNLSPDPKTSPNLTTYIGVAARDRMNSGGFLLQLRAPSRRKGMRSGE